MIQTYLEKIKNAIYGKDVRQAIHDGIKQCYEDGKAGELDLIAREGVAEIKSNIANPNLLINGDFRNPVNQRGITKYTGQTQKGYTVDRWCMGEQDYERTVEVVSGGVKITNPNATYIGTFQQIFEHTLPIGDYTLSVKVTEITGGATMSCAGSQEATRKELSVGVNTLTLEGATIDSFRVYLASNSSVTLEWAKLECGTISTAFVPRLYAEELTLCYRYYQKHKFFKTLWTSDIDNVWVDSCSFYVPMRICPTLTFEAYDEFNVSALNFATNSDSDNLTYQAQYTLTNSSGNGHRIGAYVFLDAEIY